MRLSVLNIGLILWLVDAAAAVRKYNLTITNAWRAADGHGRPIFLMNGQSPGPLIEAEEGEEIEVFVDNQLATETTMHWCV
jgi:FtsP/CotA-like multicopper oxidase with cupredoxin domain